jgi:hypothetical protein
LEAPPLIPSDTPGHDYACWYPVGSDEGAAALAVNRRLGRIQAGADPTDVVA